MGKVQLLSDDLINKIAAGEVVERPASVVKELVENAIDAKATRIDIEVENGGKKSIRIVDNGHGMSKEDAMMSLQRHATSKLRVTDDLFKIMTMGFRGEAIPSIASVCKFTMQTRSEDDDTATQIYVEGGKPPVVTEVGRSVGTTMEVREIFFNLPARRKFLRADGTEFSHIAEAITRLAVANPQVRFRLTHNRRVQLQAQASTQLKERVASLLGRQVGKAMYPIELDIGWLKLRGLFSRPDVTTQGSKGIYFFVNGRFIKHRGLAHACKEAYRGTIEKGRFPYVVLFIELDPAQVDVNVHPQKIEVRFQRENEVYNRLLTALRNEVARTPWLETTRLTAQKAQKQEHPEPPTPTPLTHTKLPHNTPQRPTVTVQGTPVKELQQERPRSPSAIAPPTPQPQVTQASEENEIVEEKTHKEVPVEHASPAVQLEEASPELSSQAPRNFQEFRERFLLAAKEQKVSLPNAPIQPVGISTSTAQRDLPFLPTWSKQVPESNSASGDISATPIQAEETKQGFFSSLKYIGQFSRMYLLFELGDMLILIDQHAAHERITYQKLMEGFDASKIPQQRFLIPPRLELSLTEAQQAELYQEQLEKLGIELEPFGGQSFALKAIPSMLKSPDPYELIRDLLEELSAGKRTASFDLRRDDVLMRMACHGSVRGPHKLSPDEVRALQESLDEIDFKANCPHGRPIYIEMPKQDIEKKFHRT